MIKMKSLFFYQTPIGKIGIAENGNAITNLYFHDDIIPDDAVVKETELLKDAGRQLEDYFTEKRKDFELPLEPSGTEFMLNVWKTLQKIPYGQTRNYQEIAQIIGNENASRAVGLANNKNPIPVIIPCHRVIGKDGKLTGYRGGLNIKEYLLKLEKAHEKP